MEVFQFLLATSSFSCMRELEAARVPASCTAFLG